MAAASRPTTTLRSWLPRMTRGDTPGADGMRLGPHRSAGPRIIVVSPCAGRRSPSTRSNGQPMHTGPAPYRRARLLAGYPFTFDRLIVLGRTATRKVARRMTCSVVEPNTMRSNTFRP